MRTLLAGSTIVLMLLFSFAAKAQITEVQLGVNGLTCSQCTRNVEMQIRKLDFVKDVQMNLEHTEGKIYFKQHEKVDIDKIAKAVINAGFSVRYLNADLVFKNTAVSSNYCYAYSNDSFQFIKTPNRTLNGTVTISFIGREFLTKKELKKWQPYMKASCTASGKAYYVTIPNS